MAWILDKEKGGSLPLSPSLNFNNLTTNIFSLAYIHKGSVVICDLDGRLQRTLNNDSGARAFQVLLCSGEDFDFLVIALNTGVQVWSSDGKRMMYFFDSKGRTSSPSSSGVAHFTQGIALVPKGRLFIVGCSDGDVFAFEAKCGPKGETCELSATLRGHAHAVTCTGADAEICASGDASGTIIVWSIDKHLARECFFPGDGNPATAVCARHRNAIAAFSTGHLRIFDTLKRTLTIEIAAHSRIINAIDLHPKSMHLVTVGEDMYLNVWELPDGGREGPPEKVGLLASSHAENRLLSGVQFLADGSHRILGTSYDCNDLHVWHKL